MVTSTSSVQPACTAISMEPSSAQTYPGGLPVDPLDGHPTLYTVKTLGVGGTSQVVLARNRSTGAFYAVKLIPRGYDHTRAKYIMRELCNHHDLSLAHHPHIVELIDVFLAQRYLAVVMEFVDGENMQVFLEKAGGCVIEPLARFLFQQLIIAVDFCHRKGKVNRDIKPSNLLLKLSDSALPLLKMADFGLSKDRRHSSAPKSQVGTALYVAPEVMANFSGLPYDGAAADMWSCGVVLYMMLFGRHPFLRPEDDGLPPQQQVVQLFRRMTLPLGSPDGRPMIPSLLPASATAAGRASGSSLELSLGAGDLLARLLERDPQRRLTMQGVLSNAWFRTALPEGALQLNDIVLAQDAANSAAEGNGSSAVAPVSRRLMQQLVIAASAAPPPAQLTLHAHAYPQSQAGQALPHQGMSFVSQQPAIGVGVGLAALTAAAASTPSTSTATASTPGQQTMGSPMACGYGAGAGAAGACGTNAMAHSAQSTADCLGSRTLQSHQAAQSALQQQQYVAAAAAVQQQQQPQAPVAATWPPAATSPQPGYYGGIPMEPASCGLSPQQQQQQAVADPYMDHLFNLDDMDNTLPPTTSGTLLLEELAAMVEDMPPSDLLSAAALDFFAPAAASNHHQPQPQHYPHQQPHVRTQQAFVVPRPPEALHMGPGATAGAGSGHLAAGLGSGQSEDALGLGLSLLEQANQAAAAGGGGTAAGQHDAHAAMSVTYPAAAGTSPNLSTATGASMHRQGKGSSGGGSLPTPTGPVGAGTGAGSLLPGSPGELLDIPRSLSELTEFTATLANAQNHPHPNSGADSSNLPPPAPGPAPGQALPASAAPAGYASAAAVAAAAAAATAAMPPPPPGSGSGGGRVSNRGPQGPPPALLPMLAQLHSGSLPSPATLALVDAAAFAAGHGGLDSPGFFVPSYSNSMDWCGLSARSESLLSLDALSSSELLQGSIWHKICKEARDAAAANGGAAAAGHAGMPAAAAAGGAAAAGAMRPAPQGAAAPGPMGGVGSGGAAGGGALAAGVAAVASKLTAGAQRGMGLLHSIGNGLGMGNVGGPNDNGGAGRF